MSSDFFDRCLASIHEPPSLNPHVGTGGVCSNITNRKNVSLSDVDFERIINTTKKCDSDVIDENNPDLRDQAHFCW